MRLYHGALERVERPRIMPRELYRPLDFGTGFYTTTDLDQAKRWVCNRLKHFKKNGFGYVSVYDFNESAAVNFKVKRFEGVCVDWLRFIAENRLRYNVEHGFDLVIGPVANDRVYTVLTLYEGGYYDENVAMEKMKGYRLADQYLFHTEKSLSLLKDETSMEIGG